MNRKFLFSLYQTPRGKLLQTMEAQFLRRAITVSCKQQLLQIGGLGWENEFVDCSLYQNYTIIDGKGGGHPSAMNVIAKAYNLPVQTELMDLVIVPHLLEFDVRRFQSMREVHRVLKPGGELVILNFNPWSFSVRMQHLWDRKLADSWDAHFIRRRRILDWLKLMNYEVISTVEFGLDSFAITHGSFRFNLGAVLSMAYGVKAVKRQYSLIPLTPVQQRQGNLSTANCGLESSLHNLNDHD